MSKIKKKIEKQFETIFNDQKEQNKIFYNKLGNINSLIGTLNATIEALNKQNNTNQQLISNNGGSFGGMKTVSAGN